MRYQNIYRLFSIVSAICVCLVAFTPAQAEVVLNVGMGEALFAGSDNV